MPAGALPVSVFPVPKGEAMADGTLRFFLLPVPWDKATAEGAARLFLLPVRREEGGRRPDEGPPAQQPQRVVRQHMNPTRRA